MDTQPQNPQDLNEDFSSNDESQDYGDESSVYSDGRVVGISEFGDDTQEYDENIQDYDDESQDVDVDYNEDPQVYDDDFDDTAQNYDGYEDKYDSYSDEQTSLVDEFYDDEEVEETIIYSKEVVDKWHKRCIRVLIFPIIFSVAILLSTVANTTFCLDSCGTSNYFTIFLIWILYRPSIAIIPISALVCSGIAFSYSRRKELVGDGRARIRNGLLILSIGWLVPALFVIFAIIGPSV